LFGNASPSTATSNESSQSNATSTITNPTSTPLPNPWGPTTGGRNDNVGNTNLFASNLDAMGNGMDMNSMTTLLQNPMVQNMMQQVLSNPELFQQMVSSNPMLRSLSASNPYMHTMMQNPEFFRQLSNPQTLNSLVQMQNAMRQLQSSGLFNFVNPSLQQPVNPSLQQPVNPSSSTTGNASANNSQESTGNSQTFDFTQMLMGMNNLMGNADSPLQTAQQANTVYNLNDPPAIKYRVQLEQLKDMGFTNQEENIKALEATGGSVQLAIEQLLSQRF